MTIHRSLAAGVGLAALATSALAQTPPPAEDVAALRAQVQALSARLEQLESQSRTAALASAAVAVTPSPVAAPHPVQITATSTPATPAPIDWATGLPELRSSDGAFTFKPRIRVTADLSTTFGSDYPGRDLTTTELRGLRLGGQGKIAGGFSYWIECDIADNAVSVANAFIAYNRKLGGRNAQPAFEPGDPL